MKAYAVVVGLLVFAGLVAANHEAAVLGDLSNQLEALKHDLEILEKEDAESPIETNPELTADDDDIKADVVKKEVTNVAEGKPAYQSSEGWGGKPGKAVDGKTVTRYRGGSCTHTRRDKTSWWSTNLGAVYDIKSVKVFNRMDCCSERLSGARVVVMDQYENPVGHCGAANAMENTKGKEIFTLECPANLKGQFVAVYHTKRNYLTLCEVQVFGELSNPQPEPRVNLALNKPSTQARAGWRGYAKNGNDGNPNTNYRGKSCTHTHRINGAWWQVNLLANYAITKVQVFNRMDCCSERLSNFKVNILDEAGEFVDTCGRVGDMKGKRMVLVECDKPILGRYVQIKLEGKNYLTLCEVIVEGLPGPTLPPAAPSDCSFDKSGCGWDLGTWQLRNRYTPSMGTGPDAGDDGTRFMYFDASQPAKAGLEYSAKSAWYTPGQECMKFKYHMHGATEGSLKIKLSTAETVLWEKVGDQGVEWKEGQVTVGAAEKYKVLFVAKKGETWSSDMAIDSVHFIKGACAAADEEVRSADEIMDDYFKRANSHVVKRDEEEDDEEGVTDMTDEEMHAMVEMQDVYSEFDAPENLAEGEPTEPNADEEADEEANDKKDEVITKNEKKEVSPEEKQNPLPAEGSAKDPLAVMAKQEKEEYHNQITENGVYDDQPTQRKTKADVESKADANANDVISDEISVEMSKANWMSALKDEEDEENKASPR